LVDQKRYQKIKRAAEKCFDYFATRNPLKILNKLEIPCSIIDLEGGLNGFTHMNQKGEPWVYINKRYRHDELSVRIIAAHELGHILLHSESDINMFEENTDFSYKEYEADIFVMELMPKIQPYYRDYTTFSPEELRKYIYSWIC